MSAQLRYITLRNSDGQYSIWPVERELAYGWEYAGFEGTVEECLKQIEGVWTDMRPVSLQPNPSYVSDLAKEACIQEISEREPAPFWSGSIIPLNPSSCIHHLFERHAQANPDGVALTYESRHMTYRELDEAAEALANRLAEFEVGPDSIVMVLANRSLDLVISLLAILKAGGCYLSLETSIPQARLNFILEDASPCLVITQGCFSERFEEHSIPVLLLDHDKQTFASAPRRERAEVTPEHLAYISYTSGSTGTPKGVCVPHRAVSRLVDNAKDFSFTPNDVFLLVSPVAFDASTFELWSPLTNGGRLVIYDSGMIRPDLLSETIRTEGVTTVWLTAGLFQVMVNSYLDMFKGLKHVLAGGDVISSAHLELLLATHPHLTFTNGYGPTENTTFSTCWTTTTMTTHPTVPIGSPINGTWAIVCDENLNPMPPGQEGELYVAGAGLARGYLNNPAETASRFVPNPWSKTAGARMLRTGDLARWFEDGGLEFIGRADRQVKIQGYRVEPDEVEMVITKHRDVQAAVVTTQEDGLGNKRLLAYVVTNSSPDEESRKLTGLYEYLCQQLPPYMVPWAIMPLAGMPLTPNGKVDRGQLPAAVRSPRRLGTPYTAPRNAMESELVRLWGENLLVEPVGIHDNFFSLGGDSLILSELIVNMENLLETVIPARFLYLKPTVAELAVMIEDSKPVTQG
ncbi:amino acid adenylation domain-containing protein [Paenibacillus sp. 11B]|uniref:amino acid adenylation domain-containing protein n=1 Tax=Paenibacillus sp. 11B TaxID=3060965 RepID=UPI0026536B8D|nr:amino acid adenylation domain-containing protein [Paenibacillus sp. 11B]MDN8590640.1 amino acid adenylation domain-containing protein [Paenibacillus sp. 11B]